MNNVGRCMKGVESACIFNTLKSAHYEFSSLALLWYNILLIVIGELMHRTMRYRCVCVCVSVYETHDKRGKTKTLNTWCLLFFVVSSFLFLFLYSQ